MVTAPGVPWLALHLGTSESLSEARPAHFQRKPRPGALDAWTAAVAGDEKWRSAAGVSTDSGNPHGTVHITWTCH